MPKILYEADNLSSFTWKDLPEEALIFVHEYFFTEEMTEEEYINTYFQNKLPNFKHEADRLFEEGKKKCLSEGTFPEGLQEVWTRKVIKKSEKEETNKGLTSTRQKKTKDKNATQRAKLNQSISQSEETLDELARLSTQIEETSETLRGGAHSILGSMDALISQNKQGNKGQLSHEQSLFLELQHSFSSYTTRQNETIEEIGRKTKNKKEEQLETLYQERNKLEW